MGKLPDFILKNIRRASSKIAFRDFPDDLQQLIVDYMSVEENFDLEKLKDFNFTIKNIPLSSFPRVDIDDKHARGREYAMETPLDIPVILVGDKWIDGRHRVFHARQEGKPSIPAIDLKEAGAVKSISWIGLIKDGFDHKLTRQAQNEEVPYFTNPQGTVSVSTSSLVDWGQNQVLFGVLGDSIFIQSDSRKYGMDDIFGYLGLLDLKNKAIYLFPHLEGGIFDVELSDDVIKAKEISMKLISGLRKLIGLKVRATPYTVSGERGQYIEATFTESTPVLSNIGNSSCLGKLGDLRNVEIKIPILDEPDLRFGRIFQIKNRAGQVIYQADSDSLKECVEKAVREGANLSGANLYRVNLLGANLSGANLTMANLEGANLSVANLAGANLTRANFYGANLSGANLTGANLLMAYLTEANLAGVNLEGATLYRATLTGADLSGAILLGAILAGANLSGVNLSGVNLSGVDLWEANLSWADLTGATLYRVNLTGGNLTGANLSGANIERANLWRANLTGANIKGANLKGTILEGKTIYEITGETPKRIPLLDEPDFRFGEMDRRAQADNKRLFIEDLYNLKSSIADILRDDEGHLQSDIEKLLVDHAKVVRQDPRIKSLGLATALKDMLGLESEVFDNSIEKYKRYNNFYNERVVKPIKDDLSLWGVRVDPSTLSNGPLSETIVQPSTVGLIPKIPQYLKLQKIPEISKEKPSKSWHSKLEDVSEMLKVLGRYIPSFEKMLDSFKWIDQDTRSIIDLSSDKIVNLHIPNATSFHETCGQIASRMKTAQLVAVRGLNHIYVLEEIPSIYRFSPTANRELIDILWKDYVKSGKVQDLATRMQQLVEDRAILQKKFKQVYQQWSLLYTDTARRVGVESIQPIELQLVRYGQKVVTDGDLLLELKENQLMLEKVIEELRDVTSVISNMRYMIEGSLKQSEGGEEPRPISKVAQLREPPEAPIKLEIPEEYGPAPEIPPVEGIPARPPKLPVSEEFLPMLSDYDLNLYYSVDGRLTPPQAISMAGRNEMLIAMTYQKADKTGDPEEMVIKNYTLEPYSYRYKLTKKRGRRKYFFGFDRVDNTIKCFLVNGIKAVQILPEFFAPRWEIEFR